MATYIPPARTTFFDNNGLPLAGGYVIMYLPNTETLGQIYQDAAGTMPQEIPLRLDAAGRTKLYGTGNYRQIVTDVDGNLIWDELVSAS